MKPRITPSNQKILKYFYDAILNEANEKSYQVNSRQREYKMLRWVYYKLCTDYSTAGCSAIADSMGQDHATVLHANKNFEHELPYEKAIEFIYEKVGDFYVNEIKEVQEINEINDRIRSLKNTIVILETKKKTINAIHIDIAKHNNYNLTPILGI